jgi:hypothetical protein
MLKPDGVLDVDKLARQSCESLCYMERLREKTLDAARAGNHLFVCFAQLFHAKDGDDVLQLVVALEDLFDPLGSVVMLFAHDVGGEDA